MHARRMRKDLPSSRQYERSCAKDSLEGFLTGLSNYFLLYQGVQNGGNWRIRIKCSFAIPRALYNLNIHESRPLPHELRPIPSTPAHHHTTFETNEKKQALPIANILP